MKKEKRRNEAGAALLRIINERMPEVDAEIRRYEAKEKEEAEENKSKEEEGVMRRHEGKNVSNKKDSPDGGECEDKSDSKEPKAQQKG